MRRFLFPSLIAVLFFGLAFAAASEKSSDQIVFYSLNAEGDKEIRNDFSPGEKIYAAMTFLPDRELTSVEFRWINPLNKREQVYSDLVRSPMPLTTRTIRCWLYLPTSFFDRFFGSKYFGRWLLEVWVDNRLAATKAFSVGN